MARAGILSAMRTVSSGGNMSKLTSIALVATGTVLAIAGLEATPSFTAAVSRLFTTWSIDMAIGMVILGVAAVAFGLIGAWRARSRFD